MKKVIALVLALTMVFALTACGQAATTTTPADTTATDAGAAEPQAIDWPKKTIKMIVGYGAGGDTDLAARVLADALGEELGVSVIVENLTGGTGVVGRTELLASDADGYTLMFDQFGSAITQVLLGNTTYTLEEAGTPICTAGTSALALCVAANNSYGITNMEDFIAYAKDHPGDLTYSTPGQFTFAHLVALATFSELGIELASVATDGTATAITEVLGGHVSAICAPLSGLQQYIESGDMLLMGLSGPSQFAAADAPVLTDYGTNEIYTWYGVWGANGMDEQVVKILSDAFGKITADEAVMQSLKDVKIETNFNDNTQFNDILVEYRQVLKDALVAGGAVE